MADISTMTKDQLAVFAKDSFNVELDLRKNIDALRTEVTKLEKTGAPKAATPAAKKTPTHLLNRNNNRVLPYTAALEKYLTNAIPCDENGKPV